MQIKLTAAILAASLLSCARDTGNSAPKQAPIPVVGTWKLITGITIDKNDTTVTDYTQNRSFIKIINDMHFAFLQHDLNKGKDSSTAAFSSGGGSYSLTDSVYVEHLEYCSERNWEGNDFTFTVTIEDDTLTQKGVEQVESIGVNRINIEKYTRVKQ